MSDRLPLHIDPLRLAHAGEVLRGCLSLEGMERLHSLLSNEHGQVDVVLRFGMVEERWPMVSGSLNARVDLVCQRCMGPMRLRLSRQFNLYLVKNLDQAERAPDPGEVFVVEQPKLAIKDLVEDELILALPIVPMHGAAGDTDDETRACVRRTEEFGAAAAPEGEADSPNPFAVLATLKSSKPD